MTFVPYYWRNSMTYEGKGRALQKVLIHYVLLQEYL